MYTIPPKMYAVNCKLFWEILRYAAAIFGSETIVIFMQLYLPCLLGGDSFSMQLQISQEILGTISLVQLQFWSFSELISHKFLGRRG